MKRLLIIGTLLTLACTTAKPPDAERDSAVRNPEFRNVQVLSHEMSREQLLEVMKRFTQALGVRCDHCHVVTATEPKQEFDFPSDAKEAKRVARVMIQMSQQINGPWLERVEEAEGHEEEPEENELAGAAPAAPRVGCWTCHRGKTEPEMPPPLPPRT